MNKRSEMRRSAKMTLKLTSTISFRSVNTVRGWRHYAVSLDVVHSPIRPSTTCTPAHCYSTHTYIRSRIQRQNAKRRNPMQGERRQSTQAAAARDML